jgi:hypothetical protein
MTGKLFDASTASAKTGSREAVEAAIERSKGGVSATWEVPHKQPSIPQWDAGTEEEQPSDGDTKRQTE